MSVDLGAFEEWPITTQADNLTNQSEANTNMLFLHCRRENVCKHVKFAFQNRLGQPYSREQIYRFCFVLPCILGQSQVQAPDGAYIWRGGRSTSKIPAISYMYMKVYGHFSFQSVKCPKGVTDAFYGCEKLEKFQWQGYEKGSLLTEVSHDEAKMRGRREPTKGVPSLSKMVYKRGRGRTSGWGLPV